VAQIVAGTRLADLRLAPLGGLHRLVEREHLGGETENEETRGHDAPHSASVRVAKVS
jgi:hypothetical protein